jgi:hypothetical protein
VAPVYFILLNPWHGTRVTDFQKKPVIVFFGVYILSFFIVLLAAGLDVY